MATEKRTLPDAWKRVKSFVAITTDGSEYFYRRSTVHGVPVKQAEKICQLLNECRYILNDGEKWHVYAAEYSDEYAESQRFYIRSGKLKRATYY